MTPTRRTAARWGLLSSLVPDSVVEGRVVTFSYVVYELT